MMLARSVMLSSSYDINTEIAGFIVCQSPLWTIKKFISKMNKAIGLWGLSTLSDISCLKLNSA